MFKALDITTQTQIVILDVAPSGFPALRAQAKLDQLCCPVCHQPVWSRTGFSGKRRPHFAHKHLGDCPSSHDSPELLQARALLYQWLKNKFNNVAFDTVKIEERPPGWNMQRSLDAWVLHKKYRFAYWLVDRQMKPDDREHLKLTALSLGACLHVLFLAQTMRRNNTPKDFLNLTTTERFYLQSSKYDLSDNPQCKGSLNYLDENTSTVITFRAMSCTEPPQRFSGRELSHPLTSMLVSPISGQFVHPGEKEGLERYEEKQRGKKKQASAHVKFKTTHWIGQRLPPGARVQPAPCPHPIALTPVPQPPAANQLPPPGSSDVTATPLMVPPDKEAPCTMCGQVTNDWWYYDPKTHTCKCNVCLRAKRFD